ncbi:VPS11, partial [Symbiodinium pilosum]
TSQFTDVTNIVVGLGRVFVLSRGGADGNTVLFELREKPLEERLDVLVQKRMFEWAAEVALSCNAAPEVTADLYRQHGDALFEKRAYDQALSVYVKTVELGLPLEPSYVVERYLDAQRIGHVAQYLKKLHEKDMAEPEHTALLLKCYTKLKDFTTLEEFLKTTPPSQYDHATAIEVLESASYHGLAAEVAQKVGSHDDFVRISLEQFKNYSTTVEFLRSLPRVEAGRILLNYGRKLMRHAPKETVKLIRHVCDLRYPMDGQALQHPADDQGPTVDELLPVFVDDLQQLEIFLRSVLLDDGCQLPQAQAERLFPTLLELLVKSHSSLVAVGGDGPGENKEAASRVSADIMRLIRQYPSDAALANTLMVCQVFGFVDGFFYAAEKLQRHQLLMQWCFEHKDAKRLLEICKRCGPADQSLWVQALSFLASPESGGGHLEEMGEVLRHIEDSDLMPLLLVIETLRSSNEVTIGDVRPYLQAQYRRLVESAETSRAKSVQDRQEIARMQQEITQLRTQAKEFQNTRCFQCGLTLEVPAVHFFCGHSYHSYCMPTDGTCPKCSSGALPKLLLKEQREAQARNAEDFFKYLQGGAGDRGIQAMGEWCKFGAFDASLAAMDAEDEED